jgi:hypothetical protein
MNKKELRITYGETFKVTNDWSAECEQRGTSVSASSWEADCLTLTSPALASNVATALITSRDDGGYNVVRNTVTLANGETLVADRYVYKV